MARKVQTVVEFVDDLTGEVIADESDINSFNFTWLGKQYQLDLNAKNAEKFEKAIQPYIDAATEVRGTRGGRRASSGSTASRPGTGSGLSKEELANAREWLTKNGYEVSPRGRIKAEFLEAYQAAHAS